MFSFSKYCILLAFAFDGLRYVSGCAKAVTVGCGVASGVSGAIAATTAWIPVAGPFIAGAAGVVSGGTAICAAVCGATASGELTSCCQNHRKIPLSDVDNCSTKLQLNLVEHFDTEKSHVHGPLLSVIGQKGQPSQSTVEQLRCISHERNVAKCCKNAGVSKSVYSKLYDVQ
jgi:hypothetical protein